MTLTVVSMMEIGLWSDILAFDKLDRDSLLFFIKGEEDDPKLKPAKFFLS